MPILNKKAHHAFDERGFETTQNVRGFMHTLNEIGQAFIDFAPIAPGLIVDIGAAYGIAAIPIINKHINVVACDMEQAHLDELAKRIDPELEQHLTRKCGQFPDQLKFSKGDVGAVLLSHILAFLNPAKLDLAFKKLSNWLAPGGKVFIASYSPYVACFKRFIPIYEKRFAQNIKWPCWVENNVQNYLEAPQDVLDNLPETMNYLDLPPLIQALKSNNFFIERACYLDPKINNIPKGLLLDGREWTGVVAVKNNSPD